MTEFMYIGAGLAIWLAGIWVAIWQGILAQKSIEIFGRNPKMFTTILVYTILGIALVESAAIYGLVVAFSILGAESINGIQAIGAGLAIGLTSLWAGIWEGKLVAGFMDSIYRNPESKGKGLVFMVLFLALVEVVAIYGLIIAFRIIGA